MKRAGLLFFTTLFIMGLAIGQDVEKKKTEEVVTTCENCKHQADSMKTENEAEHECEGNCKNEEGHVCSCKTGKENSEQKCTGNCQDKHHESENDCIRKPQEKTIDNQ